MNSPQAIEPEKSDIGLTDRSIIFCPHDQTGCFSRRTVDLTGVGLWSRDLSIAIFFISITTSGFYVFRT